MNGIPSGDGIQLRNLLVLIHDIESADAIKRAPSSKNHKIYASIKVFDDKHHSQKKEFPQGPKAIQSLISNYQRNYAEASYASVCGDLSVTRDF